MNVRDQLPIKIGERRYEVDPTTIGRQFINPTFQAVDQGVEADERSLLNQGVWKRSATDFGWGAGQTIFDTVEESDRRRFESSTNVDVWDRHELKLHPLMTRVTADYNCQVMCEGRRWFLLSYDAPLNSTTFPNGFVVVTDDPEVASPTVNLLWEPPAAVNGAATDGSYFYVSCGESGVWRFPTGSTDDESPEQWWDGESWGIWYANDRLFINTSPDAVELRTSGDPIDSTVAETTAGSGWTTIFSGWLSQMVGTVHGIFLLTLNNANSSASIYVFPVNQTSGDLDPGVVVGQLIEGEDVSLGALTSYGSLLAVGSNLGVRFFEIGANDQLTMGPLHELPSRITGFAKFGNYLYAVGYQEKITGDVALYRFHLGRSNGDLLFPWAKDLHVPSGTSNGWYGRCAAVVWSGDLDDDPVILLGGGWDPVVPLSTTSTLGVWRTSTGFRDRGIVNFGKVTFGTTEKVMFTTLEVEHEPLPAGCEVLGRIVWADGTETMGVRSTVDGSTGAVGNVEPYRIAQHGKVVIELRSTGTYTPTVNRWTLRAVPVPRRAEIITLQIPLTERVRTVKRIDVGLDDLYEEYRYLKGLAEDRTPVELVLGQETIWVYVDDVAQDQSAGKNHLRDWTSDGQWLSGVWNVTCVSLDRVEELV